MCCIHPPRNQRNSALPHNEGRPSSGPEGTCDETRFEQEAALVVNQGSGHTYLQEIGPSFSFPWKMLFPSLVRLRWMWELDPGCDASGFAMKVTDTPSESASSFKHCPE